MVNSIQYKGIDGVIYTALKVFKYEVFSGPYFLVFRPNTEKYGPEKKSLFGLFSRSEICDTSSGLNVVFILSFFVFL